MVQAFTLTCWVRGLDVGNIVQVKISRTETVTAPKEASRNKQPVDFRDVEANTLHLYQLRKPIPKPYKNNLSKIILSGHGELLETGDDQLSEVFSEQAPTERHIHIIVGM